MFLLPGQADAAPSGEWARAEAAVTRLSPSAFPDLPATVSRHLARLGCTIPQSYANDKPHNAIAGAFTGRGRKDWAVLCSRNGSSSILVFQDGRFDLVAQLARGPDAAFLQTVTDDGHIGFSRVIAATGRRDVIRLYHAFGGRKPPPVRHQALSDRFEGKSSVIHYFDDGRWLELQGMD